MITLLESYSFTEIIIFVFLLAIAVKNIVVFIDWAKDRVKKPIKQQKEQEFQQEKKEEDIKSRMDRIEESVRNIVSDREAEKEVLVNITEKINFLIDSDKDDIKSYITKEHHYFCYQKKWIDDYSLDCIEKRYGHYVHAKGNSFICTLMNEIRALPKTPPEEE